MHTTSQQKEPIVKAFVLRFLYISILYVSTSAALCQQTSIEQVCAVNTYQKILDMALTIWSELYELQRGLLAYKLNGVRDEIPQDFGSFLDLIVGRMTYVCRSLAACGDSIQAVSVDDMQHLARIIEYIQEDTEHLLLYDTQRAATIDQLLQEIKEQFVRIAGPRAQETCADVNK